jgi:hypothetical protein
MRFRDQQGYDSPMRVLSAALASLAIAALGPTSVLHAEEPAPVAKRPQAKGEQIKGTSVWMVRPAGFEVAKRFPGFQDGARMASVMVTVVPAKPAVITKSFTDGNLAQRGMKVLARTTDPEGAASKGLFLHLAQSQAGIEFRKWMFVFGGGGTTVTVVATYRAEDQDSLKKPLRAAVLSARYDDSTAADPEAALPFVMGPSRRFTYRHVFGSSLAMAQRDFIREPLAPGEPVFVVAPGLSGGVAPEARRSLFDRRLSQTKGVRDLAAGKLEAVEIGGLRGLECVATGTRVNGGAQAVVHQVMLFDDGGYFLLQGHTVPATRERDEAEFKRLARTFRRREAPADTRGGAK